ncbi:MAG TPA: hypothetical protein VK815_16715 [Candidatus Acidoferrales bacterium]|jgi:hypothetical protein|nr:hypothetical protein [Candidatus Acidoferrales bacterium]
MIFTNSYFRAFVVCVGLCISVVLMSFYRYGVDYWSGGRTRIILSMLGVSLTITIGLVGSFSRRTEKPWPWGKTVLACFICWLATLLLMAFFVSTFIR